MGRRFGKTALGTWLLAEPALRGRPTAWFAPTYKYLDQVFDRVSQALAPVMLHRNQQMKWIQLKTGGCIDFWTLDGDDPARGRKYDTAIIDEAAMVPKLRHQWNAAIRATLTDYQGGAWFLSTPKPRSRSDGAAFFGELFDRGQGDGEWMSWQMPSTTNPFLAASEIEAARYELPELVFRQEYGAEFVEFAGGIVKREHLRYSQPPAGLEIVMGVDLAITTKARSDYTSIAVLGRQQSTGRVWVLSVIRDKFEFHDVCELIKREAARWNPRVIGIEKIQYQAAVVQELSRTTTLPVRGVAPDSDKMTRFMPLASRWERGEGEMAPGITDAFVDELLNFPEVEHDDQIDACSIAWETLNVFKPGPSATARIRI